MSRQSSEGKGAGGQAWDFSSSFCHVPLLLVQAYFGIGGAAFSGGDGRFFNPPFPMKLLRTLGCLFTLAAAALATKLPEVELVVEGGTLQPSSTVEVRFARAMVGQEQLGVAVAESPLVFTPALPGSFTWLSTRSGVYAPSAVPPLGTSYKVTLRPGLKDAGGAAVSADLEIGRASCRERV